MTKLVSSMIEMVTWDEDVLTVTFRNGAVWQYLDVPEALYDELVSSASPGRAFLAMVKGQYIERQIG